MKDSSSAFILTISGMDRAQAHQVAGAVAEFPVADALAVSHFSIDGDNSWAVEAHFERKPRISDLKAFLKDVFAISIPDLKYKITNMPDKDWVTESLTGLAPVSAGRFFVHGSHDREKVPSHAIALEIDASQAFGTGHHGTSEGCLLALEDTIKGRKFSSILDLGCGTALLAIGAAKALRAPVLATDIDSQAVEVARKNIRLNGVDRFVRCETATGFDHPAFGQRAPFDLVLANILARPLMDLAQDMSRHMAPGGVAILSGLLAEQATGVEARYLQAGFRLADRLHLGEWATLTLHKA